MMLLSLALSLTGCLLLADEREGIDDDQDGAPLSEDCDDGDAAIYPGAAEICDGLDNDCDGETDEDPQKTWHLDADGDGYGDGDSFIVTCEPPPGEGPEWVADGSDCDDTAAEAFPGAAEVCDELDNDCDGQTDEGVISTFYADFDGDGYGVDDKTAQSCDRPAGYADTSGDCDDADSGVHPDAEESDCADPEDYNCDGSTGFEDADGDGFAACEECDDGAAAVNPDADEVCDEADNDCDGGTDEGALGTFYADSDGDGYGDAGAALEACSPGAGYVADNTDCDDGAAAVNPGAGEACDGADNDCDGATDEGVQSTFYADSDGDGYGDAGAPVEACAAPGGYTADGTDCDDGAAAINEGAEESCDEADNDCDGATDEGVQSTFYADSDGDGYGDADASLAACEAPEGYVASDDDCDDGDGAIRPDADEVCDGEDNDCDSETDEDSAVDASTFYADSDGDGYGGAGSASAVACEAPDGHSANTLDCDDAEAGVSPGADERCNGTDDDCDGAVDEDSAVDAPTFYEDGDGDGYGAPSVAAAACEAPSGMVANSDDCYDARADLRPGGSMSEGWPRLGAMWLDFEPGEADFCQLAANAVIISGDELYDLASDQGMTAEEASDWLHTLNSSLVILQNVLATEFEEGEALDPTGASCWSSDSYLASASGGEVMSWYDILYVVNVADSEARSCVIEFNIDSLLPLARWNAAASSALYDGVFLVSSPTSGQHFFYDESGALVAADIDNDNVDDGYDVLAPVWGAGVVDLVEEMRLSLDAYDDLIAGEIPLHTSGYSRFYSQEPIWAAAHGVLEPSLWTLAYDGSTDYGTPRDLWVMTLYNERVKADTVAGITLGRVYGDPAHTSTDYASASEAAITAVREDWQRVRYGITSALLAGTAFTYAWGDLGPGKSWWYDEFDAGGEGVGYLGQPAGEPAPAEAPIGDERLTNGDFTSGADQWGIWCCEGSSCGGAYGANAVSWASSDPPPGTSGGYLRVTIEQLASDAYYEWDMTLQQENRALSAGTDYTLTFQARADGPRVVQPFLQDTSGWAVFDSGAGVIVDGEWREFILPLRVAEGAFEGTISSGKLGFALGTHSGWVEIDEVSLVSAELSGTWYREFDNGVVLVNTGDAAQEVDVQALIGGTFRRIDGTQDRTVNNGETGVTTVTIPAWDGLILLKE